MSASLTLPKWYDLHTHLRQDALLPVTVKAQLDMGCCGVLAMPNTCPPVAKVHQSDDLPYLSIEEYQLMIISAGGRAFDEIIVPLYLTQHTTPAMIEQGAKSGQLKAAKYYPPHGTTGSDYSYPFDQLLKTDVVRALQEHDIALCIHGEDHGMRSEDYFTNTSNAEVVFYQEQIPRLLEQYPNLRIVAEHITTKTAVDLVSQAGDHITASITPQHLTYTVGHLLQGLNYHLYCMPLVKFEEDRIALQHAVLNPHNTKFFAGTDSAPHTAKATECGCAAGCFTGGIAPQLYAEAFELAGADLTTPEHQDIFKHFLCEIGPNFYRLPISSDTFSLRKQEQPVTTLHTEAGDITPLPVGMKRKTIAWSIDACA